jgi:hypothetical protein
MKLVIEYENVTQKLYWQCCNILSYIFIFHKQFCFNVSGLKIIGYLITDNNLESPCTFPWLVLMFLYVTYFILTEQTAG